MSAHPAVPGRPAAVVPPPERLHRGNVERDLAAADWRFLLPRLKYDRILHLGVPRASVLGVLAQMASTTLIASGDGTALAAVRVPCARRIQRCRVDCSRPLPCAAGRFDLVVASAGPDTRSFLRSARWPAELRRLLRRDGVALIEAGSRAEAARLRRPPDGYRAHGLHQSGLLWLVRRKGALRLAVPFGAHGVRDYCLNGVVAGISRRGRILRQLARLLSRLRVLEAMVSRRVALLEPLVESAPGAPAAAYVLRHVQAERPRLRQASVALFARGDHDANKVTFLVFEGSRPAVVVKMPRAPEYNARLEHEQAMLCCLATRAAVPPGSYPEALFLRYHDGLAMAGQTALSGTMYRNISAPPARWSMATAIVQWIGRLGEASAERCPRPGGTRATRLPAALRQFAALYPITDEEHAFLDGHVRTLAGRAAEIPAVFQHGDTATWNVLVRDDGGVALLDWERGDPAGMPLWDLFLFLQSFGAWAGRRRGPRDHARSAAAALFEPTPFNALLVRATREYCARLELPRALVEPLFYALWLDRTLGSTRLVKGRLDRSIAFRFLRLAIAGRNRPALACLFD